MSPSLCSAVGGFSPIDHAAYNQDLDLINLLLEYGADLIRENHTFVAPRTSVIKNVYDPDCFRVLYEQLNQVQYRPLKPIAFSFCPLEIQ